MPFFFVCCVRRSILPILALCFSLLLSACLAESPALLRQKEGKEKPVCVPVASLSGELAGVVCGDETLQFFMPSPEGWNVDWDASRLLGVATMYFMEGSGFDDARIILYPRVDVALAASQEAAARKQAKKTLDAMRARTGGSGTKLVGPASYLTVDGTEFTLFFFDNGQPPNEYESAAYLLNNDLLLTVVFSARSLDDRECFLPEFRKVLEGITLPGASAK